MVEGDNEGICDGEMDGITDGDPLGSSVGIEVGDMDGVADGVVDGSSVGVIVGDDVGSMDEYKKYTVAHVVPPLSFIEVTHAASQTCNANSSCVETLYVVESDCNTKTFES